MHYHGRMAKLLAGLLLALILCAPAAGHGAIAWTALEDGLEMAELSSQAGTGMPSYATIRILRIDPHHFTFRLFSARWEGGAPRTLREWAQSKGLAAAINACMFQKDGLTATGYMREGGQVNNGRIAARYGAFFTANPRTEGLPPAAVLNRSHDDWQALLPQYGTVVQNFRLTDRAGDPLWPQDGPAHAVSAVAQAMDGQILFMHCAEPVTIHAFASLLKLHPELCLKDALYAEGGKEAALLVRSKEGQTRVWGGMSPLRYLFTAGGQEVILPNILGIVRRQDRP